MKLFSLKPDLKIYFASDIHGSQKCFNKFINAGAFYGADTLIMGGDITGKSIVNIEILSGGKFRSNFMGKEETFETEGEEKDFEKAVKTAGFYPYACSKEEWQSCLRDTSRMDAVFEQLMKRSLEEWFAFAERKLKGTGIRCYVMPGNDDPLIVTDILEESNTLINPDMKVTELGDGYTLVGCGYSNRTPWNSPRECGEEELKTKLDRLMSQVSDPSRCILAAHVPPYESGLDDAPKLKDMQVQSSGGQVEMAPAGSTAVREIIEKYQPLLGLHGHIHEAHATTKIGNTVCVNPGSDYGDGVLHGCILTVSKGRVKTDQLVSG